MKATKREILLLIQVGARTLPRRPLSAAWPQATPYVGVLPPLLRCPHGAPLLQAAPEAALSGQLLPRSSPAGGTRSPGLASGTFARAESSACARHVSRHHVTRVVWGLWLHPPESGGGRKIPEKQDWQGAAGSHPVQAAPCKTWHCGRPCHGGRLVACVHLGHPPCSGARLCCTSGPCRCLPSAPRCREGCESPGEGRRPCRGLAGLSAGRRSPGLCFM